MFYDQIVKIRVSEVEKDTWQKVAEEKRCSMSDWLRQVVGEHLARNKALVLCVRCAKAGRAECRKCRALIGE